MDFKQLEYFIACAENASFSKASEKLFTTQSNMSKVIAGLENEIGIKLFTREKSGVLLTSHGIRVYEKARKILMQRSELCNIKDDIIGDTLSIASVFDEYISLLYTKYLSHLQTHDDKKSEPSHSFDILDTEGVMDAVSSRNADIGFIYADRMHNNSLSYLLHKKGLEMSVLQNAGLVFTVGEKNKLYSRKNIKTLNLSRQKFIRLKDELINVRNYHQNRMLKELGIEKEYYNSLQTNSGDFLRLALNETPFGYLHYSILSASKENQMNLRTFKIQYDGHGVTWCYIKRKNELLKEEAANFLEFVREMYSPLT